jgi:hypothetical protein
MQHVMTITFTSWYTARLRIFLVHILQLACCIAGRSRVTYG